MVNIAGVITLQCRSFGDVVLPAFTPEDELGTCTLATKFGESYTCIESGVRVSKPAVSMYSQPAFAKMSDKLQFVVDSNKGHSKPTIDLDSTVTDS